MRQLTTETANQLPSRRACGYSLSLNRTHPMKPQFTTSHKQVHSLLKACLSALLVQSTMATKMFILSLMFFLTLATSIEALKYQFQKLKETNILFYMQDWEIEANATTTLVAGIPHKRWWILGIGTIFATDDKLTVAIERNSSEVGRAHGICVNSALNGSDLLLFDVTCVHQQGVQQQHP